MRAAPTTSSDSHALSRRCSVRILSLEDLIRSEAAAGRAKDLVDLEALRALAKK